MTSPAFDLFQLSSLGLFYLLVAASLQLLAIAAVLTAAALTW
jgi:hypothetical protein